MIEQKQQKKDIENNVIINDIVYSLNVEQEKEIKEIDKNIMIMIKVSLFCSLLLLIYSLIIGVL